MGGSPRRWRWKCGGDNSRKGHRGRDGKSCGGGVAWVAREQTCHILIWNQTLCTNNPSWIAVNVSPE